MGKKLLDSRAVSISIQKYIGLSDSEVEVIEQRLIKAKKELKQGVNEVIKLKDVTDTNIKTYRTTNLDQFKWLKGNRPKNLKHGVIKSVQENGMLFNPLLVNEKLEVLDGQHTLTAARQNKTFVYFQIKKGYGLDEVKKLNLNQKNWSMVDYMVGYSDMGIDSYKKLRQMCITYDFIPMSILFSICNDMSCSTMTKNGKGNGSRFKDGEWKFKDTKKVEDFINKILQIKPYHKGYKKQKFVYAMITLLKNKDFNFKEFVTKVKLQPTALVDCPTVSVTKELIEDIYNYRRRNKVNLRF